MVQSSEAMTCPNASQNLGHCICSTDVRLKSRSNNEQWINEELTDTVRHIAKEQFLQRACFLALVDFDTSFECFVQRKIDTAGRKDR